MSSNRRLTRFVSFLDKRIDPVYSAGAEEVQGAVVVLATVSKTGDVTDVQVVSGPEPLRNAVADAVKQWKYRPYLLDGEPVDVQTTITLNLAPPALPPNGSVPDVVHVSSGVMAGMLLSRVDPVYPLEAKVAGVQGSVVISARISKTGTLEDLKVVSGPEMLGGAALDAVKQWQYRPYILKGQPIDVLTTITVNFSIIH